MDQMSSSYKTCYRRNAVLQHAHAKQSTSLNSRLSSSTRSIDSDVQKLQKKLNSYKERQSQCSSVSPNSSTCSSPSGGSFLSAQSVMLKGGGGDMVCSAPDITLLFSPETPPASRRERTCSASTTKSTSPQGDTIDTISRRASLEASERRRRSGDQMRTSPGQDLRRMVHESKSPLLGRRRMTSPEAILLPCSSNLDRNTSNSSSSLPPPSGDNGGTTPRSPMSDQVEECNGNHECRRHPRPKMTRQRSKSFDLAIHTVDDVTHFFDKLRGSAKKENKSPSPVAVETATVTMQEETGKGGKEMNFPDIDPKYKNKGKFLPVLVVTTVEE